MFNTLPSPESNKNIVNVFVLTLQKYNSIDKNGEAK